MESVRELFQDPNNNPAAAAVGAHIDVSYNITDKVLTEANIDPHSLSSEAYEKMRLAVQHKMEGWSNANFENIASNASPDNSMDDILQRARSQLDGSWNREDVIQFLKEGAKQELQQQIDLQKTILDQINNYLTPDHFTNVVINPGTNVGQLLTEHGHNITWGAADAEILGAHVIANHELLSNYWGEVAKAQNWPDSTHYPLSLWEFDNVIKQAKAGDPIALQKLKDALHWIPAGKRFKILNSEEIHVLLANVRIR